MVTTNEQGAGIVRGFWTVPAETPLPEWHGCVEVET